jgi:predicted RNase H-like HicB family nuclease
MQLKVIVKRKKDGGFYGELAGFPDAHTEADTMDELVAEFEDRAESWIRWAQNIALDNLDILEINGQIDISDIFIIEVDVS